MSTAPELRPYQHDVIRDFHLAVAAGYKRILLVAPTAAGKTVIAAAIIHTSWPSERARSCSPIGARSSGRPSKKLHSVGIRHGIIQAGMPASPFEDVQVASIQTLWARAIRSDAMPLPPAACSSSTRRIIAPPSLPEDHRAYPDAIVLGLTATPCRGDGRGLGGIFETIDRMPASRGADRR